jgi:hypothetical protein
MTKKVNETEVAPNVSATPAIAKIEPLLRIKRAKKLMGRRKDAGRANKNPG